MNSILDLDIEFVKGVGPIKAELFRSELGFYKAADFLYDFPSKHVDRSSFTKISEITEDGQYVQLMGVLTFLEMTGAARAKRLVGRFRDNTGEIEFVWFKGAQYLKKFLEINVPMIAYGRVSQFNRKFNIAHPELDFLGEESGQKGAASRILPSYRSTEKLNTRGIDNRLRRSIVQLILGKIRPNDLPEYLPLEMVQKLKFLPRHETIRQIHFPSDQQMLRRAEARLKFEELFFHQLKLLLGQKIRQKESQSYPFGEVGSNFHEFYNNHLQFELTNAQKRVVKEIRKDLSRSIQMNRLLQGDVGSGKTIIALLSMLIALDNGFQSCIMAPTEILAQQHYNNITELLEPMGIRVGFLSGNIKGKARKQLLLELSTGAIAILIGTHAVLEDPVVFQKLGLAIIDEQHRFGVAQRAKLWGKAKPHPPHILVMTATPIPRTLAMTVYGDLDVSIIDELPPGRKPVKTIHKTEYHRPEVIKFMEAQIEEGRQIYVVFPLIEESETLDLENLQNGYEKILHRFAPPKYQISIVHGRMKQADKEAEMRRFVEGQTHIMVATTVIEVGVNVPNASVMIIENSERFGLSQLHQLRGRVGRGASQSYCILMSSFKQSKDAKERLSTMCRTNDGFEIAEVDMRLRGPGAIEGTQQSGIPDFKLANLARDGEIVSIARAMVKDLLEKDPALRLPENQTLRSYVIKNMKEITNWSSIS